MSLQRPDSPGRCGAVGDAAGTRAGGSGSGERCRAAPLVRSGTSAGVSAAASPGCGSPVSPRRSSPAVLRVRLAVRDRVFGEQRGRGKEADSSLFLCRTLPLLYLLHCPSLLTSPSAASGLDDNPVNTALGAMSPAPRQTAFQLLVISSLLVPSRSPSDKVTAFPAMRLASAELVQAQVGQQPCS